MCERQGGGFFLGFGGGKCVEEKWENMLCVHLPSQL